MSANLFTAVAEELQHYLRPLLRIADGPQHLARLLIAMGWDFPDIAAIPFDQVTAAIGQLQTGLGKILKDGLKTETLADLVEAGQALAPLFAAGKDLLPPLQAAFAGKLSADLAKALVLDLGNELTLRYLSSRAPASMAVLRLLTDPRAEPAVVLAARGLIIELGSPERCLDPRLRDPTGPAGPTGPDWGSTRDWIVVDVVALAASERRVALAAEVGHHGQARLELAHFDELAAGLQGRDSSSEIRLSIERWRARLTAADGDWMRAIAMLERALVEAERQQLDRVRLALTMERLRLWSQAPEGAAVPEPLIRDETARLDALLDRLDAGALLRLEGILEQARALATVDLRGAKRLLEGAGVLVESLDTDDSQLGPQRRLAVEQALLSARLSLEGGEPAAALETAHRAQELIAALHGPDSPMLVEALRVEILAAVSLGDDSGNDFGNAACTAFVRLRDILEWRDPVALVAEIAALEDSLSTAGGGTQLQLREELRATSVALAAAPSSTGR
ncbi:MAG: hypothetical protein KC457_11275 [Myxococcales bacterium]|nr:hypothetical protein [Myxococcales bacterium]